MDGDICPGLVQRGRIRAARDSEELADSVAVAAVCDRGRLERRRSVGVTKVRFATERVVTATERRHYNVCTRRGSVLSVSLYETLRVDLRSSFVRLPASGGG